MARPTLLDDDMIEKSWDYLDTHTTAIPTIAGLALRLSVARSTVYEWAKDKDSEFSDIYEQLMAKQEERLIDGGLKQDFNSPMTKLMLGKHGYSDKQEIGGMEDKPIAIQEVRRKIVDPEHRDSESI